MHKFMAKGNFVSKQPQLVSLWDMIEFHASKMTALVNVLTVFQAILFQQSVRNPLTNFGDIDDVFYNVKTLRKLLTVWHDLAIDYHLFASARFVGEISRTLEGLSVSVLGCNIKQLITIMRDELKDRKILYVSQESVAWFNDELSFGPVVKESFPSALEDIKEAGNCYALDRPTACVFHSMRILEFGLSALAKDVGLVFDRQQWHTIIESIESKIKDLRKLPRGTEKDERLQFLSEAAKELMYFKDGWRNHVSHKRTIYDISQAYSIISHVKCFMVILSEKLSE